MTVDLKRMVALAGQVEAHSQTRTRGSAGQSWYRVVNVAKTAEIYIYDTIGDWGVTAKDFVAELRGVKAQRIDLHINSYGGAVFDGVAIYNALLNHPAHITSIVDGIAASAASFIAMAGDEVEVEKTARLMIHDASGVCIGNARDMREHADLLEDLSNMIAEIYAERAGGPVEDWRARMLAETWFDASMAVELKLANRIAGDTLPDPSDKLVIDDQTPPMIVPPLEVVKDSVGIVSPDWLRDALKGAFGT